MSENGPIVMQDTADYLTLGTCNVTTFFFHKQEENSMFPLIKLSIIFMYPSATFTKQRKKDGSFYSKAVVRWTIKVLKGTLQKYLQDST